LGPKVGTKGAERLDDSKGRSQQSEHWRDHTDISQIDYPVIQIRSHARSLRLRDLADLSELGARILRRKIEHLLHDPRNRFAMAIRNCEQAKIIALPQERVGRRHKATRDNGAPANGQEVDDHEHHKNDREDEHGNHHGPGGNDGVQDRLRPRQIRRYGGRSLREKMRSAREQREEIIHSESAVTIGN
jgi:hypothetical protein